MCDSLPLCTGIMRPFFPLSPESGSSASVESNFNDLKHRIFSDSLPIGVEDFIKTHIQSNQGAMILAQARTQSNTVSKKLIKTRKLEYFDKL